MRVRTPLFCTPEVAALLRANGIIDQTWLGRADAHRLIELWRFIVARDRVSVTITERDRDVVSAGAS